MSIKDIGVLTTISALLLLQQDMVTAGILFASSAALCFLLLIIFLSAVKKFSQLGKGASLVPLMPSLLIPLIWVAPSVIGLMSSPLSVHHVSAIAIGSLCGIAVSSIQVILNLDARRSKFDDRTLWIISWALVVGMTIAALTTGATLWLEIEWPGMTGLGLYRVAMLFAMLASVLLTWKLLGPRPQRVVSDGEI